LSTGVGGGQERSVEDAANERQLLASSDNAGVTEKPAAPFDKMQAAIQKVDVLIKAKIK